MTPDRIREIRALLQAATEYRPWDVGVRQQVGNLNLVAIGDSTDYAIAYAADDSDAALIAAAPTIITELLEALEATQGRLREAVGLIDKFMLQGHAPQLYPGNRDPEYGIDEDPAWVCHGCGEWGEEPTSIDHSDTCPFESARRFLAGTPGGE